MKDLKDKHSGAYLLEVLLETLKDYNIEFNITRYITPLLYIRKYILIFYSITRDNASSNDTLLKGFIEHYNKDSIKFQGDIPCLAHVLNLVVQDILKAIIKDDSDINSQDIYNIENNAEEEVLPNSKSNIFLY
jgi:hypothetical protein